MLKKILLSIAALSLAYSAAAFAGYRTMTIGQMTDLPECEGTVSVNNGGNGDQVNVVFHNVQQCSNFDILANGSYWANYRAKKLQQQGYGRGGSFTIPQRLMGDGLNSIEIVVHSDRGAPEDHVTVNFYAQGVNNPGLPVNPVVPPSNGNGDW
jgi:hypothetical protein